MSLREDELRFDEIESRGAKARRAGAPVCVGDYLLCGETVRVRIAGGGLAGALLPSLAHLRCAVAAAAVPLGVDLWDVGECGVDGLRGAAALPSGRRWQLIDSTFAISDDARFVGYALAGSVVWLDRRRSRIAGWFEDAAALSLHQRGKPLQMPLAVRASDRGLQAVHATCVGRRGGAAVLLPASSGAGKSTVAMACLGAGFLCLGDDWVGLERDATGWLAHGLFSSLFLDPQHARRFGAAAAGLVSAAGEEKALLLANDVFPGQFAAALRLGAIAVPRFAPGGATAVRAASRAEVLLSLVPSSVLTLRPRSDAGGVERLAAVVREVPGHLLHTGADLDAIPRLLGELVGSPL